MVDRWLRAAARGLILLYQYSLSAWLGGSCRFSPSCSTYALEAFKCHDALRATRLVAERLCRCHPLGGHGYDPVPRDYAKRIPT